MSAGPETPPGRRNIQGKKWSEWLFSSLAMAALTGMGFWAYTLWYNHAVPFSLDAFVLLLAFESCFLLSGLLVFLLGYPLGKRIRFLRGHAVPAALVTGVWVLFFSMAWVLVKGVYYSDWGIESRYAALGIRIGQFLACILFAVGTAGFVFLFARGRFLRWVLAWGWVVAAPAAVYFSRIPDRKAEVDLSRPVANSHAAEADTPTVALIALDGLSWNVLRPLIDRGRLPHFAALTAGGAAGELVTWSLGSSPLIWNTIATGAFPREHGVMGHASFRFTGMKDRYFFPHRSGFNHLFAPALENLGLLQRQPAASGDRRTPAFWEIAHYHGVSTILINWYGSWPAESFLGINAAGGLFEFITKSNGKEHAYPNLVNAYVQPADVYGELVGDGSHGQRRDFWHQTALLALKNMPGPGIFAFYISSPDTEQHRFWHVHEPDKYFGVYGEEIQRKGSIITDTYVALDELLGSLLAALPENTVVLVLSDHGGEPVFHAWGTQGGHGNGVPGVLIMKGPGVKRGVTLEGAHILDILPTLCYLKRFPLARDWRGQPLLAAFEASFVANQPLWRIDSYGYRVRHGTRKKTMDPSIRESEMERLKSLGYIR